MSLCRAGRQTPIDIWTWGVPTHCSELCTVTHQVLMNDRGVNTTAHESANTLPASQQLCLDPAASWLQPGCWNTSLSSQPCDPIAVRAVPPVSQSRNGLHCTFSFQPSWSASSQCGTHCSHAVAAAAPIAVIDQAQQPVDSV